MPAPVHDRLACREFEATFPWRFLAVTFGWSWLIWVPLTLVAVNTTTAVLLSAVGAFGPGIGAIVCLRTLQGKAAVGSYLRSFFDFRLGWKVWVLVPGLLASASLAAWLIPELFGLARLPTILPTLWILPAYFVLMVLLGGGQEELGWRGYILDHLEERLGSWWGNLVLGLAWGLWHLPLFAVSGASQAQTPLLAFLLVTVGYSWLFAWAREWSGKRSLSGLVMHGAANTVFALFPTLALHSGAAQPRYWLWAAMIFALGLVSQILRTRPPRHL